MPLIDDIRAAIRDFTRYTGDGLPNAPVGAPLPTGDPQSGIHNISKADLRDILIAMLQAQGDAGALQTIITQLDAKADLTNSGKIFRSRSEVLSDGQASLPVSLGAIAVYQGDRLVLRGPAATLDPLFTTFPQWGVLGEMPSVAIVDAAFNAMRTNSGKTYRSRTEAMQGGQVALPATFGAIFVLEGDELVLRGANASEDRLYTTAPQWGVIARFPTGLRTNARLDALSATIDAPIRRAALLPENRPGDTPWLHGMEIDGGDPYAITPVQTVAVGANGSVARILGAGIVSDRHQRALEPDREYSVRFVVARSVNTPDPAGDAVRFAVAWYDRYGQQRGTQTLEDIIDLTVASGRISRTFRLSRLAAPGVVQAPNYAVYARPYVQCFGTTGQTDIEVIDWLDLTGTQVWNPDVQVFSDRLAAIESADAGARLATLERDVGTPSVERFGSLEAARAAMVSPTAEYVEVLGRGLYSRGVGGGDLITADGEGWIMTDPTLDGLGMVPNSASAENAIMASAAASGRRIKTRLGSYRTTLGLDALPKAIDGDGAVLFGSSSQYKLAGQYRHADSAPASRGDHGSFLTAFNGDWSKTFAPRAAYVRGADTLGRPTSGFEYNTELTPYYLYMRNLDSGHNESLVGNGGRTTWPGFRIRGFHTGQGGMMGFSSSIFVAGPAREGVTSFLANAAAANFSGEAFAGADGNYLNTWELNLTDNGFDVGAIGGVVNFYRTNNGGSYGAFWSGHRLQVLGLPLDSGYQISGPAKAGLDFTRADFTAGDGAAIALRPDQKVLFGAVSNNGFYKTANGGHHIGYNVANDGLEMFFQGLERLRLRAAGVLVRNGALQVEAGNVVLQDPNAILVIGGQRVMRSRITGWSQDTGTAKRSANATYAATAPASYDQAMIQSLMNAVRDISQTVKALKDDSFGHGWIGPTV